MIKRAVSALTKLKKYMEQGWRRNESTLLASLKEENLVGRSSHKSREIPFNKQMPQLNVTNCFEYSSMFHVKH